jgi:hypothetical protein
LIVPIQRIYCALEAKELLLDIEWMVKANLLSTRAAEEKKAAVTASLEQSKDQSADGKALRNSLQTHLNSLGKDLPEAFRQRERRLENWISSIDFFVAHPEPGGHDVSVHLRGLPPYFRIRWVRKCEEKLGIQDHIPAALILPPARNIFVGATTHRFTETELELIKKTDLGVYNMIFAPLLAEERWTGTKRQLLGAIAVFHPDKLRGLSKDARQACEKACLVLTGLKDIYDGSAA